MSETEIMRRVQLALGSRDDVRIWRAGAGVARLVSDPSAVVRFGVPGQADLSGILRGGRRLEVEVKARGGRLQPNQRAWGAMITSFGGLHVVVHSPEEAIEAVERALRAGGSR